jgi:hypothetical protein
VNTLRKGDDDDDDDDDTLSFGEDFFPCFPREVV